MDTKLAEEAYNAITELKSQKDELEAELESIKLGSKILFQLYNKGGISPEDLESKFAELSSKSTDELEVIEKAAELSFSGGLGNLLSVGDLSDRPSADSTVDPLTSFLLEDYH